MNIYVILFVMAFTAIMIWQVLKMDNNVKAAAPEESEPDVDVVVPEVIQDVTEEPVNEEVEEVPLPQELIEEITIPVVTDEGDTVEHIIPSLTQVKEESERAEANIVALVKKKMTAKNAKKKKKK